MSLEEITQYLAFCDGPSDLPVDQGCPEAARYVDDNGDDRYYSPDTLASWMTKDGWYIEMSLPGSPRRNAEVMCPKCKEVSGE